MDQFKLKIVVGNYTDGSVNFIVCFAKEGSSKWIELDAFANRMEAEAFIRGFEHYHHHFV